MVKYELVLYMRPGCSYCEKVQSFMAANKITVPLKNISQHASICEELMGLGGKQQVPCLVINAKALYESSDIIEWFKKNKENL